MRSKTVCFTGHRELPADDLPEISKHLEDALITLIEQGYHYFGAGGALGFDTLAAQSVLRLRERYPQIRLILVLPCLNQTRGWPQEDISCALMHSDCDCQSECIVVQNRQWPLAANLVLQHH